MDKNMFDKLVSALSKYVDDTIERKMLYFEGFVRNEIRKQLTDGWSGQLRDDIRRQIAGKIAAQVTVFVTEEPE